jgi:flagellar hook-associated protein 2
MSIGSFGGIYGLSGSGMDIDMIVKKLMVREQAKQDALFQKKTIAEWQKAAYNTVYDEISKFRDTVFNYKLQATLSPKKVTSSNTSVAIVTANAEAADVTHSLVVAQLAGGVNLTSSDTITTGAGKDTIANQFYADSAPSGSYKFIIANGEASADITIDATESINELVSKINKANINLKANYDSTLDRFFLSTTNTGSAAGIKITADAGNDVSWGNFFVDKLMLPEEVSTTGTKGQDAAFQLDGVYLSTPGNKFCISGVTYNLTGVSEGTLSYDNETKVFSGAGTATTISVTHDIDTAVASIQALVDSYNKIIESLNSKLKETRYKDFPPLTDAQKAEMKESEITAWEAKAKSGMLHNDPTVTRLVNAMRNAFSSPVSGTSGIYNTASVIGITTGKNYLEGGKLYFDPDKLRTALESNPGVLTELFGAAGTTNPDGTIDSKTQGIAGRLYDALNTTMTQLNTIASTTANAAYDTSSNYAKRISDFNKMISKAADRFDVMQAAYYKQFNAMEVALQRLNTQSGWLLSQFYFNG